MKLLFAHIFILLFGSKMMAQSTLPIVGIKNIDGKEISTKNLIDTNRLTVISFWASWCKPCMQELDAISDDYDNWLQKSGSKVIAISIDDSRTFTAVKNVVTGRGWPFEAYIDVSQNLKRALNITTVPYTIVIDRKGNIIKKNASYTPGSEAELLHFLIKYAAKK
jgi:peroxiredoxin